jgi:hypothetical protein
MLDSKLLASKEILKAWCTTEKKRNRKAQLPLPFTQHLSLRVRNQKADYHGQARMPLPVDQLQIKMRTVLVEFRADPIPVLSLNRQVNTMLSKARPSTLKVERIASAIRTLFRTDSFKIPETHPAHQIFQGKNLVLLQRLEMRCP